MAAYSPSAMGIVCIMLEAERTTCRKMAGIPRNNHSMAARMGLKKIPSKSTIVRSYGMIPEWDMVQVHQVVICGVNAGSLAGDSTGFSYLRLVRWFDVRADKFRTKKGWVKMHAIVDIRTRVIIDYLVTDSVTADINGLCVMLHRLGLGMFYLDSAYLAREMCDMISAMSMVPRIKPNTYATPREVSRGAGWSTCTWTTGRRSTPSTTSAASWSRSLPRSRRCTGTACGAAGRTTGQGRSRSAPHVTTSSSWQDHG